MLPARLNTGGVLPIVDRIKAYVSIRISHLRAYIWTSLACLNEAKEKKAKSLKCGIAEWNDGLLTKSKILRAVLSRKSLFLLTLHYNNNLIIIIIHFFKVG